MRLFALLAVFALSALAQQGYPADQFSTSAGTLEITPIQHASLMIQAGGQVIHVDPVGLDYYKDLPKADIILITHSHGDHLDMKVIPSLCKQETVIIAPPSVAKTVADARVLRNGDATKVGSWDFEAFPMYNLEGGERIFHPKGDGNGYIVSYGGLRLYIAGDTQNIPELGTLKNIDVAFLPINQPYTMTPEEAAEAAKVINPKVVYPYHHRGSDLKIFEDALATTGIEVRLRDWYK